MPSVRQQLCEDAKTMIRENELPVQLTFADGVRLSGFGQVNYPAPNAALDSGGNIVDKRMSVAISLFDFARIPNDDPASTNFYQSVYVNIPVSPIAGAALKTYKIEDPPKGGLGLYFLLMYLTDVETNPDVPDIDV